MCFAGRTALPALQARSCTGRQPPPWTTVTSAQHQIPPQSQAPPCSPHTHFTGYLPPACTAVYCAQHSINMRNSLNAAPMHHPSAGLCWCSVPATAYILHWLMTLERSALVAVLRHAVSCTARSIASHRRAVLTHVGHVAVSNVILTCCSFARQKQKGGKTEACAQRIVGRFAHASSAQQGPRTARKACAGGHHITRSSQHWLLLVLGQAEEVQADSWTMVTASSRIEGFSVWVGTGARRRAWSSERSENAFGKACTHKESHFLT